MMCVSALLPCRSPARPIRLGQYRFSTANSSSSPTGPIRKSCARWCPSRSRSMSRSSNTSSSACRIRPASATTPRPARSFRSHSGPQGRLFALHVSQRRSADRRRPRAVGLSQEAREPTLHAEIDTLVGTLDYGPVRVATGTMGYKHKPADLGGGQGVARGAELPAEDHSRMSTARRASASWSSTTSKTSPQGRLDRARRARPAAARAGAGRRTAGARSHLGDAHHRRPDARPRQGRPRLFGVSAASSGA